MFCYHDRTFCSSPNCKNKCGRQLTKAIREAAAKWWGQITGKTDEAPICVSEFCDEHGEVKQ